MSSEPIGALRRWIRTIDRRVAGAAREGRLPAGFRGGLHAALARAPDPVARAALVAQVVALEELGARTRSLATRLGKEFDDAAARWPERPLDLVGRHTLAETVGVSRSATPDGLVFDLMMSKRAPVVGIFTPEARSASRRQELVGGAGAPEGAALLVGVGRFAVEKRWDVVLSAFRRVRAGREAVLVLFGDGPERAD